MVLSSLSNLAMKRSRRSPGAAEAEAASSGSVRSSSSLGLEGEISFGYHVIEN